ncbi:hypothetical protein C5E07_13755 [Pseudoclavibacter sp. RFBJ3]|nr:hypothetical protein C5C12_13495 [Pseudoclavibacter sp. RFBJ5]PPF90677.1 hypothetical protein C5E07_13755 [Pseudoclavibacter sp. RFBJ3]PPF94135.1 hypothetical protein C5C19_18780 [Pseudoclavibacter sp. RFBH5]PPG17871.1 hypothetical protein C5E13_18640 [Pseudoclavibacter sp. RFBI4]
MLHREPKEGDAAARVGVLVQAGDARVDSPAALSFPELRRDLRLLRAVSLHEDGDEQAEAEHQHDEQRERDDGEDLTGTAHGLVRVLSASGGS